MRVTLSALPPPSPVDVVERKGTGHPDTMCDAIAEAFSAALSRHYLERFGAVLHHNVDKALLFAGASEPRFGGGRVVEPMELFLTGRATTSVGDESVPVDAIAHEVARDWVRGHLRFVDPDRHLVVHARVRPGSADLSDLFRRGTPRANDTSIGVGEAPRTPLEQAVLAVERRLVDPATHAAHPALGEDVKVLGIERDGHRSLTVATAMVDRFLEGPEAYGDAVEGARALAREAGGCRDVEVNAADDPANGRYYLTVTGTSAECGDDGQVGRGNRVSGLITPLRAMSLEAAAGKNPVTHVGKLYNLLALRAAGRIVADVPGVRAARCLLVSRIGRPLDDPWLAEVSVRLDEGEPASVASAVEEVLRAELSRIDALTRELIAGAVSVC